MSRYVSGGSTIIIHENKKNNQYIQLLKQLPLISQRQGHKQGAFKGPSSHPEREAIIQISTS